MRFLNLFKKRHRKPEWSYGMQERDVEMFLNQIRKNFCACNLDEIPQGFGNFGLERTNPVPTYGVPANDFYLARLRTLNGNRITWNRTGSLTAKNIEMPIDQYEIYNVNGFFICLLYLSPYHWKTSTQAPQGFALCKSPPWTKDDKRLMDSGM